jgi:hypothetical protein
MHWYPGWDKVGKLASALLALDGHVTNKQAAEITQLLSMTRKLWCFHQSSKKPKFGF